MNTKDIISIRRLCSMYNISDNFINELISFDLIELLEYENEKYISKSHIKDLEHIVHLRYELNINPEGIDVIRNLLNKIEEMQHEINELRNKLSFYE